MPEVADGDLADFAVGRTSGRTPRSSVPATANPAWAGRSVALRAPPPEAVRAFSVPVRSGPFRSVSVRAGYGASRVALSRSYQ